MMEFQEFFCNVFFKNSFGLATNLQNFCSFQGSSQNLQEQGKPLPSDSWTHFFISIFYFDLGTYLGMVQLLVAGWISLQLFDPPQMNLVACGRQMPVWRCCRWVHQAKWVPGGRFLQKSRVFQPAPLPSRSILQKVKTVFMSLSSNRNTNWSLREHKMLWEPIDHSKGFYFRVVNLSVTYGKLHVPSVGILISPTSSQLIPEVISLYDLLRSNTTFNHDFLNAW